MAQIICGLRYHWIYSQVSHLCLCRVVAHVGARIGGPGGASVLRVRPGRRAPLQDAQRWFVCIV